MTCKNKNSIILDQLSSFRQDPKKAYSKIKNGCYIYTHIHATVCNNYLTLDSDITVLNINVI